MNRTSLLGLSCCLGLSLTVALVRPTGAQANSQPTAIAGGPYFGCVGVPITFDGTRSFDQDGDLLTFAWEFGDLGTAVGPSPSHTYSTTGKFDVKLTVTDDGTPALGGTAMTQADIVAIQPASIARCPPSKSEVNLKSSDDLCVMIEPVGFAPGDVILSTIVMKSMYPGGGVISVILMSALIANDICPKNGITEIKACASKANLRNLFANIPSGTVVSVTIQGDLLGGRPGCGFIGTISFSVTN